VLREEILYSNLARVLKAHQKGQYPPPVCLTDRDRLFQDADCQLVARVLLRS
jgi:hypothetical protein